MRLTKENFNKIKKLKLKLLAAMFLLIVVITGGILISFSSSFKQFALALTGNYNKSVGEELDLNDWNNLLSDFLAKDGGSTVDRGDGVMVNNAMQGDLDMGDNNITNLADPIANLEAANKQYVDNAISAIGGAGSGGIFTNWGRADCPGGTTELYDGIGFSALWESFSGGSNPVCIQSGDAGDPFGGIYADKLYPLVTGAAYTLPAEISDRVIIRCAVCFRANSTCYEHYGSWNCDPGFPTSNGYFGYVLGSRSSNSSAGGDPHNSTKRACVNTDNFDSSLPTPSRGAIWEGTKVGDDYGTGYSLDAFIKCAVCCN